MVTPSRRRASCPDLPPESDLRLSHAASLLSLGLVSPKPGGQNCARLHCLLSAIHSDPAGTWTPGSGLRWMPWSQKEVLAETHASSHNKSDDSAFPAEREGCRVDSKTLFSFLFSSCSPPCFLPQKASGKLHSQPQGMCLFHLISFPFCILRTQENIPEGEELLLENRGGEETLPGQERL